MTEQAVMTIETLRQKSRDTVAVWADPLVRRQVETLLPFALRSPLEALPAGVRTLVVVAGGTLMDEAKVWRLQQSPETELVAIPSIWGSGAEASPIAVRNRNGKKEILMEGRLRPDARAILPELAASLPPERARFGCGDCWAHALEGFLSPLASDALRAELAALMNRMLAAALANDPVWFELGAQACAGQARSSVGLVHGLAHTLEGLLRAQQPAAEWGHARLCSLFLWPVMRFNEQASPKWRDLLQQHGFDPARILSVAQSLFDEADYDQTLAALKEHWIAILRDPCSRTNCALVRPGSVDFFLNKAFR